MKYDLKRFTQAQQQDYATALNEIQAGRKQSHWMWYIFPQIAGLGLSVTSKFYAIQNKEEAKEYLAHPVLGGRLIEICEALLGLESRDAYAIFGSPDNMKLQSSMTLFAAVTADDAVFVKVLNKYFNGVKDPATLKLLGNNTA